MEDGSSGQGHTGLFDIFGRTFHCTCGKVHHIEPREVIRLRGDYAALVEICVRLNMGNRVAALMDRRTREVAGAKAAESLCARGWQVTEMAIEDRPDGTWPVCDDITRDRVAAEIGQVDWILTVGSGVVNDLGKWIAADLDIPFISLPTAASMNGYASANVAPAVGGVKTLVRARPPLAIVYDPSILREAPYELTTAGLGDALAKTVSTADWFMNHFLFGDDYCEKSAGLIAEIEPLYLNGSEDLRIRKPAAIEALFTALLLMGVSMTMAESSSPASGGEHLISHVLDMRAPIDGVPHDLHGRQVGVGTIVTAELYRRILSTESPRFLNPPELGGTEHWGHYGDAIRKNYQEKIPRMMRAVDRLAEGHLWDRLREKLDTMVLPPAVIQGCLASAEAATGAEDIGCSRTRLSQVLCQANQIRSRFTVIDLAYLIGVMPTGAEEIVEQWA